MSRTTRLVILLLLPLVPTLTSAADRPNNLLILAEDLGYGDLSPMKPHGKITPPDAHLHAPSPAPSRHATSPPAATLLAGTPTAVGCGSSSGTAPSRGMLSFACTEGRHPTAAPTARKKWVRQGPADPAFEAVDVLPTLTRKSIE